MDLNAVLEHVPAALGALAALLAAGFAVLKFVAPLTKSTKDDDFVAEHGDKVEEIVDRLEEESRK